MLIRADARQIPLVDGCVQTVVTSPPYWGLRDYGHGEQLGLEATYEGYVTSMLSVFAEVWRVLKADGTLWLNIGDCYATGAGAVGEHPGGGAQGARWRGDGLPAKNGRGETTARPKARDDSKGRGTSARCDGRGGHTYYGPMTQPNRMPQPGLKAKDLVGIPWRVALALQAQGWYLRSDIVWSKPNPMPESITDRPTKSHEYIFLLTKSERYYYDADAIAEPVSAAMLQQMEQGYEGLGLKDYDAAGVQNPSTVKARIIANARAKNISGNMSERGITRTTEGLNLKTAGEKGNGLTRNKRSVWTVNTQPYPGSHFATFPEALIEPCILAGSRPGDLVFDPFIGSGTTGVVADRLMRHWVGTDLSYQDLAKRRTAQRGLREVSA